MRPACGSTKPASRQGEFLGKVTTTAAGFFGSRSALRGDLDEIMALTIEKNADDDNVASFLMCDQRSAVRLIDNVANRSCARWVMPSLR
jgi:hypothetical protein